MSSVLRPSPRVLEALLIVLVGLPVVMTSASEISPAPVGALYAIAVATPLVLRRTRPFLALALILIAGSLAPGETAYELPACIAVYTIATRRSAEAAFAAGAAVIVVALLVSLAQEPGLRIEEVFGLGFACSLAGGIGHYVGTRREQLATLRDRAERLQRERELLAERAVAEERVRIAQELHDVIAHNVSLIVVQAQALGATVPDPKVAASTTAIADLGRQAMAEMHRTLRLLRAEDEAAGRAPQPGLGDLEPLLERARGAGVAVDLTVEGEPRPLPQTVDLSAFRIVQEALTNVVKHAGGHAHSRVRLDYRADRLELTITDSGDVLASHAAPARPDGHGLVGMRERAALFGGTLRAGPRDGRGFEVHAVLPYQGAP